MSHSRTDDRIADFVVWSALAVYAAVWVAGLGVGLGGEWLLGGAVAAAYVGGHVFEMTRRNHCYLSADSTAAPASFIVFSSVVLGRWVAGDPPVSGKPLLLPWCIYGMVFTTGHLAAMAYSAALGLILSSAFAIESLQKTLPTERGHKEVTIQVDVVGGQERTNGSSRPALLRSLGAAWLSGAGC